MDRSESPAPLFDSETGRAAVNRRWSRYRVDQAIEVGDSTAAGVYFLQEESTMVALKIGVGKNAKERQATLQVGNPRPLNMVGVVFSTSPFTLESNLHSFFEDQHIRGEWYAITPEEAWAAVPINLPSTQTTS